ncbi:MAG: SpaA isopeptide-forming pilin-related protein, partial [Candidatus Onthomonas sp.]
EGTTFTFSGLDDGDYRLTETTTPAGYNTIEDIYFTITAEHEIESDNPALTSLSGNVTTGEITFTSSTTEGSLSTNVVNKAGSTLPETGGMGTTIFYVLGGILVVGAVVLLVTKKRMNGEK